MSEIEKDIESGKAIIRAEGINLTIFKSIVNSLLTNPLVCEDHWVFLYECYAESRSKYFESVEDWAKEHFTGFNIKEHGYQLK